MGDIDGVAYTAGPGLVGALLVGAGVARSLAWALEVPAVGVHHMEGHLLAPLMEDDPPEAPFVALLVSGGHTQLVAVDAIGQYRLLGETLDDAAGEAFDKTAKLMGLPYPGGPQLARLAEQGTPGAYRFARPMTDRPGLDFSFSGLKTQVLMAWRDSDQSEQTRADIARGFEDAVVETLSIKCERALEAAGTNVIVVAGGVGANKRLRARLQQMAERLGGRACFPRPALCTDNGAMIAFAGALRLQAGQHSPPKVDVTRAGTWRRCRRYEPVAPGLARRTHYARPAHGDAANTVVARSWCCSQPRVCGQRAWISCGNAIFKPLVQMAPSKGAG